MANPKKQVCRIMVTFPIIDTASALAVKDAIDKAVENNPEAGVQATFLTVPENQSRPLPVLSPADKI